MTSFLSFALVLIMFQTVRLEYRKLIPKCSNSCIASRNNSPRNCFCDSKCSLIYNDCCLDAPYRTFRVNTQRTHNIHCVFVPGENTHFWMIDTCQESWIGQDHIKSKCIVNDYANDIMGAVPVTSVSDGFTYKNYYCALCNGGRMEDLVEWQVKTLCANDEVTQQDILQNLTYLEDKQQWGVWKMDDQQELAFNECFLLFQKPVNVTDGIRECIGRMVSTCPRSWQNIATRWKCKSYVDPVRWIQGPVYRNIDCAECHNVSLNGFQCYHDVTSGTSAIMLKRALDVDFCSSGQWL